MSFEPILRFEQELARYTGAPYVIMTDCCTHALELCLRYDQITHVKFTAYTYVSILQLMHKLGIKYDLVDQRWQGEYQFQGTRIWDCARRLEPGMYRTGSMQCLSFGHDKPLAIGHGGAILLDESDAYHEIALQRYDGRDLAVSPWQAQIYFDLGYHYRPSIEDAKRGSALLTNIEPQCQAATYPDCRQLRFKSH